MNRDLNNFKDFNFKNEYASYKKSYKNLNKNKKIGFWILFVLLIFITLGGIFSAALFGVIKDSPKTNLKNLSNSFNQTSSIYDEKGNLLEKIESQEYRTIVPIEKVPTYIKDAFVSIEDQRFYSHGGLDFRSVLGSIYTNLKAGAYVRGASTLTQQLVKNVYLTNEKTINRKIKEAYLSMRLADNLSKEEILEAYLNRINLGQGSYGVEAASQTYFSKDVWDLNLAESALIAGIAKNPGEYSPTKRVLKENYKSDKNKIVGTSLINGEEYYVIFNPKSFERQKIVLKKMLDLGKIKEAEYKEACDFDLYSSLKPGEKKHHNMSSYSTDFIKLNACQELENYYKISREEAEYKLFTGGYKIISAIDENLQKELENYYGSLEEAFNNFSASGGSSMLNFSLDDKEDIVDENGNIIFIKKETYFDNDLNFIIPKNEFSVSDSGDLSINKKIFSIKSKIDILDAYDFNESKTLRTYSLGNLNIPKDFYEEKLDYIIIDHGFLKDKNFFTYNSDGSIKISKDFYTYDKEPVIQPESASIIIDNKNSYVRAIVGGLDVNSKYQKIFNRASDSYRSPGSLLKPFSVYLASLNAGDTLATITDDVPFYFDGKLWPENFYRGYRGLLTSRFALENNSNVAAAKILNRIGLDKSLETLKTLNLINDKDAFISKNENPNFNDETLDGLALGNLHYGFSLLDMATSYEVLARDGNYLKPTALIKIIDSSGVTIVDNSKREGKQIIDKNINFLLRDALRTNVTRGDLKGNGLNYFDLCAMQGLNKYNSDLWQSGFTSQYTLTSWLGCDSPKISLNVNSQMIESIFKKIMRFSHKGLNPDKFQAPPEIIQKFICQKSGLLGSKLCEESSDGYMEYFINGSQPKEYCKGHKKLLICNSSGRLAGEFCPKEDVEYKILFERDPKYIPSENGGIYPDDYEYIPSKECNIHTEEWYQKIKEERIKERQREKRLKKQRSQKYKKKSPRRR